MLCSIQHPVISVKEDGRSARLGICIFCVFQRCSLNFRSFTTKNIPPKSWTFRGLNPGPHTTASHGHKTLRMQSMRATTALNARYTQNGRLAYITRLTSLNSPGSRTFSVAQTSSVIWLIATTTGHAKR
jgi:hypothetical protein